jgi:toxin ParE1/3/4
VPSSRRLGWSVRAEVDLAEIWLYLFSNASKEVADAQLNKIRAAAESLQENPFRGRPRNELRAGLRSVLAQPYVVFYTATDASLEIVRVLHGRRNLAAALKEIEE